MSDHEDKKLGKPEYFDLRERRLKLVYKILYVVVAIWIAILLSISQNTLERSAIPVYAFLLSASSMVIIQIIKYAIMEFRCMKIVGTLKEELLTQTEARYENIWVSFSLILSLCGLALIPHYFFVEQASINVFMAIFFVCIVYFMVISVIRLSERLFEKDPTTKPTTTIERIFDVISIVAGCIAAYSLCAAACLITIDAIAV